MSQPIDNKKEDLTRRKFLRGAGVALGGLALGGGVGAALLSTYGEDASAAVASPSWPMEYKPLDPDVAAKRGYDGYFKDG